MSEDREEGKDYEVIDKRKVRMDENGEVVSEPAPEVEAEEESASPEEQFTRFPKVDVQSLLKSFIAMLAAHSWQWLGLVKNPNTDKVEPDLDQAKTAIDAVAALVGQLESKLSPDEQRELRALLSDLQINYVQQSAKGS